jgi:late competence protein required for DNA uptake (superfamily II DNA/RNA helicase)
MSGLASARCLNHEAREAASRCPSCANYFCRECVVIFEDRVTCAACLKALSGQVRNPSQSGLGVSGVAFAIAGLLSTWFVFYAAAWIILQFRERVPAP